MELTAALDLKDEIRAELPSFVRRHGASLPPIAVGIAPKQERRQYRIAVRVRSENDLIGPVRAYLNQATAGEIDLRATGNIKPSASPLALGASTAHKHGLTGTLGCFARRADGTVGFISNNHVIAAENAGADGDDILHPGGDDGGQWPRDVIGYLDGSYPRLVQEPSKVDCAFARMADGIEFDAVSIDRGDAGISLPIVPPERETAVSKVGRTTRRTYGTITAFRLDEVVVDYSIGPIPFYEQIEIESADAKPFSQGGDSGSLIFTREGHPVGLLFAASAIGGKTNRGLTYANPLGPVFSVLSVTLLT